MRPLPLLTLLLVGCGHASPKQAPAPGPSFADHPSIVACRTRPGACQGSAWRALRGEGDLAGDWAAAAFLLAGCEGGHAPSCADLGELYAAGRGVPADPGRACELGRSASCAKAGRSPPFVAATPSGPLPPPLPAAAPARPAPADVQAYADRAWSLFTDLQAPLGLTRDALAATPPAPPAERALLNLVVARRMPPVQACLPAEVAWSDAVKERETGLATFVVGADGRPEAPMVKGGRGAPWPDSSAWGRCAAEIVGGWSLPLVPSGGRFWLTFAGTGEPARYPGPDAGAPRWAVEGYRRPEAVDRGCVAENVHLPYRLGGFTSAPVTTRFAVGLDGQPRWFEVISGGVPPGVIEAIWKAVRSCAWRPGADPDGKPAELWVVLPVKFDAGE